MVAGKRVAMADDIDVKAEGKRMRARQAQASRDTADDEDYARQYRKQKGWNKKRANSKEMYDIIETDPNTPERKTAIRRDEYLLKTTADKRRVGGSSKSNSRVKGKTTKKTGKKKVATKR
jgi:hypothetical protein